MPLVIFRVLLAIEYDVADLRSRAAELSAQLLDFVTHFVALQAFARIFHTRSIG